MFEALRSFLASQPVMLLFLTIGLGYLCSKIRIKGISLGMASVLFVGIALGSWGKESFLLPDIIHQIGLLLFVYTVGLEAGPAFFRLLRRRGVPIAGLGLTAVFLAATIAQFVVKAFGINPVLAVGLFCGGLTNTPALAAATELLKGNPDASLLTIGYSIAYPLAVFLPITIAQLTGLWKRVNLKQETKLAEKNSGVNLEPPIARNLRVATADGAVMSLEDSPLVQLGVKVSRIQRGQEIRVATPETTLEVGDVIHIVGSGEQVDRATHLNGFELFAQPGPESQRDQVDFRRILLTNPKLFGRTLGDVGLERRWNVVITRLRRGDIDFVPTAQTVLEDGDRLRVVAKTEDLPSLTKYLGDSLRALGTTDYLTLSLGILFGVLLGSFTLYLPGDLSLRLGLAGGPLVAALILGWRGKTGPFVWALPAEIAMTFREFGLVLFFTGVGIKSGAHFMDAIAANGIMLLGFGAMITLASTIVLLIGSLGLLKLDWVSATGILAGGQTQPAILSFIGNLTHSEAPNVAYASIMPTAMVAKIIMAQILLWWLASD